VTDDFAAAEPGAGTGVQGDFGLVGTGVPPGGDGVALSVEDELRAPAVREGLTPDRPVRGNGVEVDDAGRVLVVRFRAVPAVGSVVDAETERRVAGVDGPLVVVDASGSLVVVPADSDPDWFAHERSIRLA